MVSLLDPKQLMAASDDVAAFALQHGKQKSRVPKRKDAPKDPRQVIDDAGGVSLSHPAVQQAAADTQIVVSPPTVSGVDGAINVIDRVAGTTGMVGLFGPVAVGAAASAVSGLGKLTGLSGLTSLGGTIRKPVEYFSGRSFADLGRTTGVGGTIGRATQGFADTISGTTAWIANATGLRGLQRARHLGRRHIGFDRAQQLAGQLDLAAVNPEFADPLRKLHTAVTGAKTVDHLDIEHIRGALQVVEDAASSKGALATEKAANKTATRFVQSIGKTVGHHDAAHAWKDVAGSVKAIPKTMADWKLSHGVINGAFTVSSAISMVNDGRNFTQNLAALKQMYADITGKDAKNISTLGILMGTVPETVAEARSHLIKNTFFKEISDVLNVGVQLSQLVNHRFSGAKAMVGMGASMAVGMGADALMGASMLPVYKSMSDAFKAGQELPADAYAMLLGTASKDLRVRGGAESQFTKALAEQYAAEKLAPAAVMKEINSGHMMVRLEKLIEADEASKKIAAETHSTVSHAEKLKGGSKEALPVVGKHTKMLNRQVQTNNIEQGLS